MNERIQKLLIEAHKQTNGGIYNGYLSEWTEKFAELIVQECARVARANPCPYEDEYARNTFGHTWDMASIEAGREIVKHFGLK